MQIEDIYGMILKRQIEGIMFHDEMAQYYAFIGLNGYKHFHKEQAKGEMNGYRRMWCFYIDQYGRLPAGQQAKDPEAIPALWRSFNSNEVTASMKKDAVKEGIEKYIEWETETIRVYEQAYTELWDMGDYVGCEKLKQNLLETDCELSAAKHRQLLLNAVDYDMPFIIREQEKLYDKS